MVKPRITSGLFCIFVVTTKRNTMQSTTEVWKPVQGYEGIYEVSNLGRIRSLERTIWNGKNCYAVRKSVIKKDQHSFNGYRSVPLSTKGVTATLFVHRLVASAFIPNPENKPMVNHKDGNKKNNFVDNLEWVTRVENMIHAFAIGLQCNKGERHPSNKLTEAQVLYIRNNRTTTGEPYNKTAKRMGMSKTQIMDICNRKSWSHI